jgi:Acetyltransferase (GNAT) domain
LSLDESYPARYGSGGLLASGGLRASDVTHVLIDLLRTTAVSTRVKPNHDTTGRWEAGCVAGVVSIPRRLEVLDLDGGFSRVWDERFKPAARRAVRKAERSGLVVERDSSMRLIAPFYDLYLEWTNQRARESGVPARVAAWLARRREPLRKLQAVAAMVGDACRIWVARYDDCPVAAIITLVYRNHAIYWQGYSSKAFAGPLRANNLLQRLAIEDACEAGCRWYSMGESGGVRSLMRFKQTLGATPRRAVDCRIERLPLTALEGLGNRAQSAVENLIITGSRHVRHPAARRPHSGRRHRVGPPSD